MQSSNERRRLMNQMYREPAHPMVAVAKCGAGLVIVTLLVTIDLGHDAPENVQPTNAPAASTNANQDVSVRTPVPVAGGEDRFRRVDAGGRLDMAAGQKRSARDRAARITAPLAP
jgi:hypothetical protein